MQHSGEKSRESGSAGSGSNLGTVLEDSIHNQHRSRERSSVAQSGSKHVEYAGNVM